MENLNIHDVAEWTEALERNDEPIFYNYLKHRGYVFDDPYDGARIGERPARHPHLARCLFMVNRRIHRLADWCVAIAGLHEVEMDDGPDEGVYGYIEDGGLYGLHRRIGARAIDWAARTPIYDEAKVAENQARIAEKKAARPQTSWGWGSPDKEQE